MQAPGVILSASWPAAHTWTGGTGNIHPLVLLVLPLLLLLLRLSCHKEVEPIHQKRVLIIDATGLRKMSPLHSLTERIQLEDGIERRWDFFSANKEVYLVAEAPSPASCSTF